MPTLVVRGTEDVIADRPGSLDHFDELTVDAATIKAHLHYPDGRRELAAIRSRTTRAPLREALHLTDAFRRANDVTAGNGTRPQPAPVHSVESA